MLADLLRLTSRYQVSKPAFILLISFLGHFTIAEDEMEYTPCTKFIIFHESRAGIWRSILLYWLELGIEKPLLFKGF
jgi:hypothetical protein